MKRNPTPMECSGIGLGMGPSWPPRTVTTEGPTEVFSFVVVLLWWRFQSICAFWANSYENSLCVYFISLHYLFKKEFYYFFFSRGRHNVHTVYLQLGLGLPKLEQHMDGQRICFPPCAQKRTASEQLAFPCSTLDEAMPQWRPMNSPHLLRLM